MSGVLVVVSGPIGVGKTTVSRLLADAFDRSVHLQADDFMAAVAPDAVDPDSPDAGVQYEAIGAALAVAALRFVEDGWTVVVDGHLFPDGVQGLAHACAQRGAACHYVVLRADPETCWARASARVEGRWPLEAGPAADVYARFAALDLDQARVVDADGPPESVAGAVLAALQEGDLAVT